VPEAGWTHCNALLIVNVEQVDHGMAIADQILSFRGTNPSASREQQVVGCARTHFNTSNNYKKQKKKGHMYRARHLILRRK
jgi:hypothetical protein